MRILSALFLLPILGSAQSVTITKKMSPPTWALLERELIKANSEAAVKYGEKYLDSRGYLLHTPRWGTLDGPDDAIETFFNWTLMYALGGSDAVLRTYQKALEGHLQQYKEMRTVKTKLAENGAYYKEFITQSDWFHTGEGMRGFMFLGLADPNAPLLRDRLKRFAGMYMNEDPEAPNYDPVNKVIKSIWTGSKGPMLHKATTYDWVGDPVPGSFHLLHGPKGRGQLINLNSVYDKMLAHCAEYLDSVGDHPLNLASTGLATNAYMLTGEKKYKDWVLEYVGAWKQRTDANGGNIPTNIGLNGQPGGEYGGKWYKGTYGWNFTIYDGEIDKVASRNTVTAGSWPGFGNAYLVSQGDAGFVNTLRKQLDNLYAQKKTVNGKVMIPSMFGDPRGYKYTGREEWYEWTPNLQTNRLTEIYLWSMDRKDLERVPVEGWLAYLEGKDPSYPEKALRADLEEVRKGVVDIDEDNTTPDTRLADYVQGLSPVTTDALTKLTLGSYLTGNIWTLHSRVRYFDPVKQRSGLPEDVAALVEKFDAESVTLSLVNTNQVAPRTVVVQAGAYAEHQFLPSGSSAITVKLAAGAGDRLTLKMKRYANAPTLRYPWDR
ncbi:MAG: hypothetical protein U0R19_26160 [Bryobacteraceae bacterium]